LLGPSWQRLEQAGAARGEALAVVLDLTPRMLAADLPPSRLEQARRALADLLEARRGEQTGIVVYAGSAHALVPLSDDQATALDLALLEQAGRDDGRLLLLTSGLSREEQTAIDDLLPRGVRLDIVGVGSASGAPILQEDGSFLKDEQGNILIARLDAASHERF